MKNLTYIVLLFFACQNEPTKPVQTNFVDVEFSESFDEKQETSWSRLAVDATASPSSIVGTAEQEIIIVGSGFGTEKGRVYFGSYFVYGGQILQWTDTHIVCQVPVSNTGNYTIYVKSNDGTTLATANSVYAKWGVYKASGLNGLGSYKLYNGNYADTNGDGFRTYHCPIGTSSTLKNTIRNVFDYLYAETGLRMVLGEDVNAVINDLNDGIWMLGVEEGAGVGRATVRFTNCGDNTFYASDGYASWDGVNGFSITAHEIVHTLAQGHGSGLMCGNTSCISSELSDATKEGIAYLVGVSINKPTSCKPIISITETPDPQPTYYTYYQDLDGDGYGSNIYVEAESRPVGYVTNNDDCDDTNPFINPDATEIRGNGIDENCNGMKDDRIKGKRK